MQFGILILKEIRARIQRRPYRREVLTLRDNTQIALDWVKSELVGSSPVEFCKEKDWPVCVLLHGAFMDSSSATMIDLAKDLAALGFPVVVMNRRGYGGMSVTHESPGLAMFGLDEDLDEVLARVSGCEPGRPVAIVGFSCGSGFAGRYPGKRPMLSAWFGEQKFGRSHGKEALPRILCSVCYDPGYDVSPQGAISRIRQPFRLGINIIMKYTYAFRHRSTLVQRSDSFQQLVGDILSPRKGAVETYRLSQRLSGVGGSTEWLPIQQPLLHEIEVPCLAINSRDDPICVWSNVEDHLDQISANPNIVLAELAHGSHGCKFDFWGTRNIVHPIIAEFVAACWKEWSSESASDHAVAR